MIVCFIALPREAHQQQAIGSAKAAGGGAFHTPPIDSVQRSETICAIHQALMLLRRKFLTSKEMELEFQLLRRSIVKTDTQFIFVDRRFKCT